ncbi:forkhead box [Conglomerata obtusa]
MDNREKELDDAAEAMLMLSKQKLTCANEEVTYAILKGDNWKEFITVPTFKIDVLDKSVHFIFNEIEKVWRMIIVMGNVIMNNEIYSENSNVFVVDGAIIDVQSYSFFFYYGIKPKKNQKSYQKIIIDAIQSSNDRKMTLAQIYKYFIDVAGFSINDSATWKNSIRHNLSLNKIFKKVPRGEDDLPGKGAYWALDDKGVYVLDRDVGDTHITGDLNDNKELKCQYKKKKNPTCNQYSINFENYQQKRTKKVAKSNYNDNFEFDSKYIVFQKPSEVNYNTNFNLRKKRKNNEDREDLKRIKCDVLDQVTSSESDSDICNENKYTELDNLYNNIDTDVFNINNKKNCKITRSQSIIELPDELASLSLSINSKDKKPNKKPF